MADPSTTAAPTPAIRLRDIVKSFGPVQANRGASLEVARGEIHALVGENGAGKSTLMRVLAGMYAPNAGTIEVDGRNVTGWTTAAPLSPANASTLEVSRSTRSGSLRYVPFALS